ncbi:hypothetical protein [Alkalimarinus alittae]|uniref:Uncharacterized protein n=1 Tax=Alkalimarinus alittae TaxID=2961619 RepID=A0ABY6N4D9_9ALTE|nr:hypothetical protein [Alkalimarinus alittae]UZE96879.1 hypothetical protein NKI27_03770 [Alkalimarinus alittae]
MIKRPTLTIAITVIFLIGFAPWYLNSNKAPSESIRLPSGPQTESAETLSAKLVDTIEANAENSSTTDTFNAKLAKELIAKYGDKIDHLAVQANLFKVRDYVINKHPEDGHIRFNEIIHLAFPDQAQSIINIIELMSQYTQWLAENYRQLNDMPPLERDGQLWKKRRDIFGDAADVIWAEERELLVQKQRKVQQEIHRLGLANDLSTDEKLYQLTTTLSDTYGDTAQSMVIAPNLIAKVFFGFDSVQQTLESLSPQERQDEINRVRQKLGYSEEQIAQAQKKDEYRNQRWEKGLLYMAERQALVDQFEGKALDSALANLRETHFKKEAYTIEKEEVSGFYRYARPRIYGRN